MRHYIEQRVTILIQPVTTSFPGVSARASKTPGSDSKRARSLRGPARRAETQALPRDSHLPAQISPRISRSRRVSRERIVPGGGPGADRDGLGAERTQPLPGDPGRDRRAESAEGVQRLPQARPRPGCPAGPGRASSAAQVGPQLGGLLPVAADHVRQGSASSACGSRADRRGCRDRRSGRCPRSRRTGYRRRAGTARPPRARCRGPASAPRRRIAVPGRSAASSGALASPPRATAAGRQRPARRPPPRPPRRPGSGAPRRAGPRPRRRPARPGQAPAPAVPYLQCWSCGGFVPTCDLAGRGTRARLPGR